MGQISDPYARLNCTTSHQVYFLLIRAFRPNDIKTAARLVPCPLQQNKCHPGTLRTLMSDIIVSRINLNRATPIWFGDWRPRTCIKIATREFGSDLETRHLLLFRLLYNHTVIVR